MFTPNVERRPDQGRSITQYGVQPPNSSNTLIITENRAEAECALDSVADGRVVHRTITYSGWQAGEDGELGPRCEVRETVHHADRAAHGTASRGARHRNRPRAHGGESSVAHGNPNGQAIAPTGGHRHQ
jgi:hypothetical protein